MRQPLFFRKVHGLGNDFLVFLGLDGQLPLEQLTAPDTAQTLCHRHTGVGGDGLLLVLPPRTAGAQATMRVINADGGEAEMCGNGIRCVAKVLAEQVPALAGAEAVTIDTGAGPLRCALSRDEGGQVATVTVEMGRPRLQRPEIPMRGEGRFVDGEVALEGIAPLRGTAVSMGNPHLVFFVDPGADPRAMALELGPRLEHHPDFPNRTNVEFALAHPWGLELWVWERGCGLTLACGTGACATAVAAALCDRHPAGERLEIRLPGGPLWIQVAPDYSGVSMEGPAAEVFQGQLRR